MFHTNIKHSSKENTYFRNVLFTASYAQVVVMSLLPGEDIGEEIHDVDQILVFIHGSGKAVVEGVTYPISQQDLFFIPAGTKHNFINTGTEDLKLYTLYAPPHHKDKTIHKTKEDAMKGGE